MVDFSDPGTVKRNCNTCGIEFDVPLSNRGEDVQNYDTTRTYDSGHVSKCIVDKFIDAGMEAKLICNCEACVLKYGFNEYEMWIKSVDEKEWHKSVPNIGREYQENKVDVVSDFEYGIVLDFLTVPDSTTDLADFFDEIYNNKFRRTELDFYVGEDVVNAVKVEPVEIDEEMEYMRSIEERGARHKAVVENKEIFFSGKPPIDFHSDKPMTLAKADALILKHTGGENFIYNRFMSMFAGQYKALSYKGIIADYYQHHSSDAGFIKTQIDKALSKVLGANIIYDKNEIRRNIEFLFPENKYDFGFYSEVGEEEGVINIEAEKRYNEKIKGYIAQALDLLDRTKKDSFTLAEYSAFMNSVYSLIQYPIDSAWRFMEDAISNQIVYRHKDGGIFSALYEQAEADFKKIGVKTIAKTEIQNYVKESLIPNARLDSKMVKAQFLQEFNVNYMSTRVDIFGRSDEAAKIREWYKAELKKIEEEFNLPPYHDPRANEVLEWLAKKHKVGAKIDIATVSRQFRFGFSRASDIFDKLTDLGCFERGDHRKERILVADKDAIERIRKEYAASAPNMTEEEYWTKKGEKREKETALKRKSIEKYLKASGFTAPLAALDAKPTVSLAEILKIQNEIAEIVVSKDTEATQGYAPFSIIHLTIPEGK
jgi:hypothetical protein